MAQISDVVVSVEAAIHEGVRDAVANWEKKYGVRVENINVEWVETSTMERPSARVLSVQLRTTKSFSGREY